MRRLAWTFAARIGDKYQIRLARPKWLTESKKYARNTAALFSVHFYQFYTRRNDDLEIDLTIISFEKAFETKAGDRLASYSVMQDKYTLISVQQAHTKYYNW